MELHRSYGLESSTLVRNRFLECYNRAESHPRVWAAVLTKQLGDKQPVIDWTSGSIFASSFTLFFLFDLATMATQTTLYWIISQSAFPHLHRDDCFSELYDQCPTISLLCLT